MDTAAVFARLEDLKRELAAIDWAALFQKLLALLIQLLPIVVPPAPAPAPR